MLMSKVKVNDGNSHVIVAQRIGQDGVLIVDEQPKITGSSGGNLKHLNGNGNIYLGESFKLFAWICKE